MEKIHADADEAEAALAARDAFAGRFLFARPLMA